MSDSPLESRGVLAKATADTPQWAASRWDCMHEVPGAKAEWESVQAGKHS